MELHREHQSTLQIDTDRRLRMLIRSTMQIWKVQEEMTMTETMTRKMNKCAMRPMNDAVLSDVHIVHCVTLMTGQDARNVTVINPVKDSSVQLKHRVK